MFVFGENLTVAREQRLKCDITENDEDQNLMFLLLKVVYIIHFEQVHNVDLRYIV